MQFMSSHDLCGSDKFWGSFWARMMKIKAFWLVEICKLALYSAHAFNVTFYGWWQQGSVCRKEISGGTRPVHPKIVAESSILCCAGLCLGYYGDTLRVVSRVGKWRKGHPLFGVLLVF